MPQVPRENNDRMSLRITTRDKTLLLRAAALEHTNLTEFVIRNIVSIAQEVIDSNHVIELSEKNSLEVMALLDNPPQPNKKLMAAAFALPKNS